MGRIGTRTVWGSLLSAGIAAIAVGAATAAVAADSRPPTLTASRHTAGLPAVTYGQSIRLSGHVTHAGLRTVALQADPFPFATGFRTVARTYTRRAYAFTVTPARLVGYRVVVSGAGAPTSRVVAVYVIPQGTATYCNLCTNGNGPGRHVLVVKGVLRPDAGAGPFYFYYGQVNGSSAPTSLALVKVVAPQVIARGVSFTVSYEVHFPSGPSRFRYTFCRKDDLGRDGYGLPGHDRCGDATVATGAYLGVAG